MLKATRAQIELRVTEIIRIRLAGGEIWDVKEYVREQEKTKDSPWLLAEGQDPISERQLFRYIARADREITEVSKVSRKRMLNRHLGIHRNLYARAYEAGDYRTALACSRSECELRGLFPAKAKDGDAEETFTAPVAPSLPFRQWSEKYLGSYFTLPPSSFHEWLAGRLNNLHEQRGTKLDIIAPRGAAKSTWSSFAYVLYAALHALEPYLLITSDTTGQAVKFLSALKAELLDNEALRRDYPQLAKKAPIWRADEIRLANGVAIEALGTGSKVRGRKNRSRRPSLIIADDPQNRDHITSPVLRSRTWDWLTRDVCNAGNPETNIIVLGTPLHREAIVCKLEKTSGWECHTFRSIVQWPKRMDLWAEWQNVLFDWNDDNRETKALAFYEANKTAMEEGAVVLWPALEPLYQLMVHRATIGVAAFASEKQSDPIDPSLCEWPEEYFAAHIWFDEFPPHIVLKTLFLDPSKGKDAKHGDYSAYVRLGRDRNGVLYVEADLQRRNCEVIVADGVEHCRIWQPDGFGCETNQFQELLVAPFQAAAQLQGVTLPIHTRENSTNKEVRIRRLGPYLSQRLMRFKTRSPGTALLIEQLKDFPHGEFDDGPDSLEGALHLAIELFNAANTPRPAGYKP